MTRLITIVFIALVAGCHVGSGDVRKMPAAVDRAGARGVAAVGKVGYRGELLAVRDSSLLIRTDSARVVSIHISKARFVDFRPFVNARANFLREQDIVRLRRISRFPFGIPESALAEILAKSKSVSVEVIEQ